MAERDPDCVFCAIVAGELEAEVVLDDDVAVAFLDNRPLFHGHVLLVPRDHHETIEDLPEELVGPLFSRARRLARAVRESMGAQGTFVAMNNVVSQSVPHLHVHVVPRDRRTACGASSGRAASTRRRRRCALRARRSGGRWGARAEEPPPRSGARGAGWWLVREGRNPRFAAEIRIAPAVEDLYGSGEPDEDPRAPDLPSLPAAKRPNSLVQPSTESPGRRRRQPRAGAGARSLP